MDLYIAEKNTLAETLCTFLSKGKPFKKNRYQYDGPNFVMTSCLGHTMELCDASQYDKKWAGGWTLESLPILPVEMKYKPIERQAERLKEIIRLCNSATRIIHCGDPDREGQYLVDIVIANSNFRGEVFRWWPDDLSATGLEKSFRTIKPNKTYESLGVAAKYRAWADWIVGINYTRLYTLTAKNSGHQETVSIGRVQTPTFSLVHNRCIEIENFKPVQHYGMTTTFKHSNGATYKGTLKLPDDHIDEHKRCLDREKIEAIDKAISGNNGVITSFEETVKSTSAPLPYSLSALQEAAGRKWGYTLKEVLAAAQYLYEELAVLTYPRTDCRYLSEGDFQSSGERIKAISQSIVVSQHLPNISTSRKSRCFNDKKTTAHTAIVPTTTILDLSKYKKLSESDKKKRGITSEELLTNIYEICALRFIQQFLPEHEDYVIDIKTVVNSFVFNSKLKKNKEIGWKAIDLNDAAKQGADDESSEIDAKLALKEGDSVKQISNIINDKKTTPPPYFTEGSLAIAMGNIASFVEDPEIKKRLRDTDGIGTEATRTQIVERLKTIGVISTVKGKLISTSIGRSLFPSIPVYFRSPAMTAIWEAALNGIAEGRVDHNAFHKNICAWTEKNITRLKEIPPIIKFANLSKYKCPKCESMVVKSKGKFGDYWRCVGADCKATYQDFKKEPLFPIDGHGSSCKKCNIEGKPGVMLTKASKPNIKKGVLAKVFLGCSNYPACKNLLSGPNK